MSELQVMYNALVNKSLDILTNLTSTTFLGLNYAAWTVNLLQGQTATMIEAAGGRFITKKNLIKAEAAYFTDAEWARNLNDLGKRIKTSDTNMLFKLFAVEGEKEPSLSSRYSGTTKLEKLSIQEIMHSGQNFGEHMNRALLLNAMLRTATFTDNEGNTFSFKDALTPELDAEGNRTGRMLVKPEYRDIITPRVIEDMSMTVKEVYKDLHGNYYGDNKARAQRYALLKQMYMLRKWLIPGIERRYMGLTTRDKFYSEFTQEEKEGYYITTARFLKLVANDLRRLKTFTGGEEWHNLSDYERGNILKTINEAAIMMISLWAGILIAALAKGLDDEEDEGKRNFLFFVASIFRRLFAEYRVFSSFLPLNFVDIKIDIFGEETPVPAIPTPIPDITEAKRIIKTPAVTISMIDRILEVVDQLGDPLDTYPRDMPQFGIEEGDSKLWRKLKRVIPGIYQFERKYEQTYDFFTDGKQR
jgi:hypothetical protein